MTQALFYSSTAVQMSLTAPLTSGATSCSLSATTGLPVSYPFKLLLDWGAGPQEVVYVTNLSGTTATITRGQDGTTAQAHSIGAVVVHGVSAEEFNDTMAHIGATAGVHGVTGSVVGTTDAQTLTNKTLTTPTIASIKPDGVHTVALPSATDTLVGKATTDTLTNKTLTSPNIASLSPDAGTHTLTMPVATDTLVGKATTDTLTNKTLTAPAISNPALSGTTTGLSATSAVLDAASTLGGLSGTVIATFPRGRQTSAAASSSTFSSSGTTLATTTSTTFTNGRRYRVIVNVDNANQTAGTQIGWLTFVISGTGGTATWHGSATPQANLTPGSTEVTCWTGEFTVSGGDMTSATLAVKGNVSGSPNSWSLTNLVVMVDDFGV